jgi:hypothetical protein
VSEDVGTAIDGCPNCGNPRAEAYCPECGQRQGPAVVSMRALAREFVEDQLSLDAALPRTLRALFLRPGLLSREYVAGRGRRHIPPVRVYLLASVMFFLVVAIAGGASFVSLTDNAAPGPAEAEAEPEVEGSEPLVNFQMDTRGMNEAFAARWAELQAEHPDDPEAALAELVFRYASTTAFLLVPVFAVLLMLFHLRSGRYYVEHLIFALHQHAFAFAVGTVVVFAETAGPLVLLWLLVYTFLAMRRFYGQSRWLTAAKTLALSVLYMVVVAFGIALSVGATLLLS